MLGQTKVAVSIEGNGMRVLTCEGRSVRSWNDIPLDTRFFRNGFLADARGFTQALSGSQGTIPLPKGNTIAAMPGLQHFARVLRVPKEAAKHLGAVVAGEIHRSIPDAERNLFVFWQGFGPKNTMQLSVFVIAVPRQPLITFVEALNAVRMRPKALDLRPIALARAVNRQDAIIGNSEIRTADVVIVRDDIPVMMRSLHLGEEYDSLDYVNQRLPEEIARTLGHYNATSAEGPIAPETPVYLTGRGAAEVGLPAAVEDMTQHPVAELEPPIQYPHDFPVREYMVHLGLVLK